MSSTCSVFERDFFPIYPASAKLQSWDIYACVRQVLAVLDPVADPLPESILRERNLMSEDEALRAMHLAENAVERERGRGAPDASTRPSGCSGRWSRAATASSPRPGPPAPLREDGLRAALLRPAAVRADRRAARGARRSSRTNWRRSRPMNRMLQGEVGSGKTIVVAAGDAADGRCGLPVRAAGAHRSACRPACPVDPRRARPAGDGGSTRRLPTTRRGSRC